MNVRHTDFLDIENNLGPQLQNTRQNFPVDLATWFRGMPHAMTANMGHKGKD